MIIPAQSTLTQPYPDVAVPLARYAYIIEYDECSFFGVDNPDAADLGCDQIWSKADRDMVQKYLAEAQDEIEQIVNYPLSARWIANEAQNYRNPVQADWGHIIEAGVKAITDIVDGEAVSHVTDPAIIGPFATTVTDENEITVYHPGTDLVIIPSSVTISGGNCTIEIPRCRMVKTSLVQNPAAGLSYSDTSNFEATVDVKRVYNDTSTNAVIVWPHKCTNSCGVNGCGEKTQTGCMYIRNAEIGSIDVLPATYSGGSWAAKNWGCCNGYPEILRLNYRAGLDPITPQAEDAIVRLAHSKMPDEVCGCERWSRLWRRDRNVPDVLTRERLNCSFGLSDGAWIAWQFTQRLKLVRGYTL